MPKYPQVKVKLVGEDGNAFAILGRCVREARKCGLTEDQVAEFQTEATSGSYDHLLTVCMNYFDCDPPNENDEDEDWGDEEDDSYEDEDEEDEWADDDDPFFDEEEDEEDYWDYEEDFEDEDDDE